MRRHVLAPSRACLFLSLCLPIVGQTPTRHVSAAPKSAEMADDPSVILEVGAATSWTVTGGAATFAPNFGAEITPIEDWLELEAGVSPFFTRNATEWDMDLLFKKPWALSKKAEFMLGVGPGWAHLRQERRTSNSAAADVAVDFMFWPTGRHRLGWFLEPAYSYSFAGGHPQSVGMTAGLLIGLRRRH